MKTGIVICSRADSTRIPRKAFAKLNHKPMIEHLLDRCARLKMPVVLAIPGRDFESYKYLAEIYDPERFSIHLGHGDDPLARMADVANKFEFDYVIRVCHDKIFVEPDAVSKMLADISPDGPDYIYSSTLPDGAAIEVISRKALNAATARWKKIEHVSYAVRAVSDWVTRIDFSDRWKSEHRFLVDFPADLDVLDLTLKACGNFCSLDEAIEYLDKNWWLSKRNRAPSVTVYTCGYNAAKWIDKAMGSVAMQKDFGAMEYLLIDDASTDAGATLKSMQRFADRFPNVKTFPQAENKGLASCSNVALSNARGRYIIRLDADDYFTSEHSIAALVKRIEETGADAVYPDNFFGSNRVVQPGSHSHHVGGTLFRTRAANHVKFTEGLRGYEGLDFFIRARDHLYVAYLPHPTFFYRQHAGSMSKNNLEERKRILETLTSGPIDGL